MVFGTLPKFSVFRTNYAYRFIVTFIFDFWIIIFIFMHIFRLKYKFFRCFFCIATTIRASVPSIYMFCRGLPKFTMFRTYYAHFCLTINVLYFWIVIFITMNLFCFFYKSIYTQPIIICWFYIPAYWTSLAI